MTGFLHALIERTPLLAWAGFLALCIGLEMAARRKIGWAARRTNLANGGLVLLAILMATPLIAMAFAGARKASGLESPLAIDEGYPGASILGVGLFLLAYDLGYYAFHRLQHANPWLWRFHSVHHSDTRMNASTYMRQHVLENIFQAFLILIPLLLLVQVSAATAAWAAIATAMLQFFVHADLPIHYGPLSRVLASPLLHRIHHSSDPVQGHANFASTFPAWDVLFGTYAAPAHVARTGLHDGTTHEGLAALVLGPFRRVNRGMSTRAARLPGPPALAGARLPSGALAARRAESPTPRAGRSA